MTGKKHAPGLFVDLPTFHPRFAPSRAVRAYIPAGNPDHRPILVLFDGQNIFHDDGSYAGGWHAHEEVDRLVQKTVISPIVVGIANGGEHRIRELGPLVNYFVDAVVRDVVPNVRAISDGPIVLGGASLGGLASLVGWLCWPDVFSGAMAMSPSLWFARGALYKAVERGKLNVPSTGKLYLDVGGRESPKMWEFANKFAQLVQDKGLSSDRFMWRPDRLGRHHESSWRRRLLKALRFLFRS